MTLTKLHVLLERRGVVAPYRTLHRFAVAELGFPRCRPPVPVATATPGWRCKSTSAPRAGPPDPARETRRVTHGLIFTAVSSRHLFVFLPHRQTLEEVVAGFDAAWAFYGGVFAVIIPNNLKPLDRADPLEPRSTTPPAR